ncbi:MAG: helix-turn-helix domain-containing protein [Clostridiales bacterium]|jgi:transcriptional regulator with XRE-family HTH domain|nr:helix-turn-helix domain-containing protein [Clostridiales bacterium]
MDIGSAVRERINEYLKERNITVNKLASLSDMTQSTLSNLMNSDTQKPTVFSIQKICSGLDVSLSEFFSSDVFTDVTP